jgi:hypothetical protein
MQKLFANLVIGIALIVIAAVIVITLSLDRIVKAGVEKVGLHVAKLAYSSAIRKALTGFPAVRRVFMPSSPRRRQKKRSHTPAYAGNVQLRFPSTAL